MAQFGGRQFLSVASGDYRYEPCVVTVLLLQLRTE